jgi:hypothetical protein
MRAAWRLFIALKAGGNLGSHFGGSFSWPSAYPTKPLMEPSATQLCGIMAQTPPGAKRDQGRLQRLGFLYPYLAALGIPLK